MGNQKQKLNFQMKYFTLACLIGLAASIKVVDPTGNQGGPTDDGWVDPCAHLEPDCPDPCADSTDAECYSSEAGEAFFKCYDDNSGPWDACYLAQDGGDDSTSPSDDTSTVVDDGSTPPVDGPDSQEDRGDVALRLV